MPLCVARHIPQGCQAWGWVTEGSRPRLCLAYGHLLSLTRTRPQPELLVAQWVRLQSNPLLYIAFWKLWALSLSVEVVLFLLLPGGLSWVHVSLWGPTSRWAEEATELVV